MDDHTRPAAPPPTPLVATKLAIPPLRPALVARPRLMQRLDACLVHPLTLISAPAGFGKTTLVSGWAHGITIPLAWLSLDEADNNPTRFLRYLVAAIRQAVPAVGRDLPDILSAAPPDAVVATLINDIAAQSMMFVLVLDDYHVLDDEVVQDAMRRLVAYQPPQMRLVIVTREDPQLPLARLRARGQLIDLRAHDLRFTAAEVAAFLGDVMGVALDEPQIADLDTRIEGWIAGWQLAALSMQGRRDPTELLAGLSGSHHFILSYLTEEVLAQIPADIQQFLMDTAILDRLTGPLCDAVTERGDSDAVLERLYAANVFVVALDDAHHWYRYHHLFADLLRSQLDRKDPGRLPMLRARASAWHEDQGNAAEAIEYAFAAADYARVVRLVEAHARSIVLQGYARSVEDWLRRLPPAWQVEGPRANLAFCWSLLLRGQLGEIERHLGNAEAAAAERERLGDTDAARAIRAEMEALRAGLVSLRGDTERACDMARAAVAQAPPDDLYLQGMARFCLGTAYNYAGQVAAAIETYQAALPLCRAANNTLASMLIVANLGVLYLVRGQLQAADDLARRVLAEVERADIPRLPALATVYMSHSEALYERNNVAAAHAEITQWLDVSHRGGHVAAVAYGHVLLSRIEQARGDLDAAKAALRQAAQLRHSRMPAWVAPHIIAQDVALALSRGDIAAAAAALAASGVAAADGVTYASEVVHIAHLRLLLHLGRSNADTRHLDQALDLGTRLIQAAEAGGRLGRVIETLALRALAWSARGDEARARADLGRALALAEPQGYARVFLNEGEPMRRLMADLRATQPVYVAALLTAFGQETGLGAAGLKSAPVIPLGDRPARPAPEPLVEPLTDREREVLGLLAAGLSYEEIAQRLFVSLNTVRFHVRAVYGKLGVNRRAAAIERATALGLL